MTNTFKVIGLDDDKIHYFKITSINSGGESNKSETISSRTLPLPPSEFNATTLNKSSILLKWNLSKGAEGYRIYRAKNSSGPFKMIAANWSSTIFIDQGLLKETVYYYKISGIYRKFVESEKTKSIAKGTKFHAPQTLRLNQIKANTITLEWDLITHASAYHIFRDGVQIWSGNNNEFTDLNLKPNTLYSYSIAAYSYYSGIGDKSIPKQVFTLMGQATNLKVQKTGYRSRHISWDEVDGAQYYEILRSSHKNGNYEKLSTDIIQTSFEDHSLNSDQLYFYKVRGHKNNALFGEYSVPVSHKKTMTIKINKQCSRYYCSYWQTHYFYKNIPKYTKIYI